jgi:hypothetical protein
MTGAKFKPFIFSAMKNVLICVEMLFRPSKFGNDLLHGVITQKDNNLKRGRISVIRYYNFHISRLMASESEIHTKKQNTIMQC